jgi:transcriptional regulator GlxA family with amidase domain
MTGASYRRPAARSAPATIATADVPDCVIVCGGNEPTQHLGKPLLAWLRRLSAHGVVLGALDTGAFALGAAGVIRDRAVTLHWEAKPVFLDTFPDVTVKDQIFVIDRDLVTAAGGSASLDLMLQIINRAHGSRLTQVVANAFVHGRPRPAETPQRPDLSHNSDDQTVLRRAVRIMANNIAFPLGIDDICDQVRTSRRRLERAFMKQIGRSPAAYYIDIRLQTAREQLFYSNNQIAHIAEVVGFQSNAHFCRAFRKHFGASPTAVRKEFNQDRRHLYHPAGSKLVSS